MFLCILIKKKKKIVLCINLIKLPKLRKKPLTLTSSSLVTIFKCLLTNCIDKSVDAYINCFIIKNEL